MRYLASTAAHELKRLDDAELCTRLLAIAQTAERPVSEVATAFHISARTLFRWISAYRAHGLDGLKSRPRGHRRSKLSDEHKRRLGQWVAQGINARGESTHWTLEKLRAALSSEFGISISIMPLWLHLRKMGFQMRRGGQRRTLRTAQPA